MDGIIRKSKRINASPKTNGNTKIVAKTEPEKIEAAKIRWARYKQPYDHEIYSKKYISNKPRPGTEALIKKTEKQTTRTPRVIKDASFKDELKGLLVDGKLIRINDAYYTYMSYSDVLYEYIMDDEDKKERQTTRTSKYDARIRYAERMDLKRIEKETEEEWFSDKILNFVDKRDDD